MRRFLILLLAGSAALVGAVLIAPFVVDLDAYRGDIAREAGRAIGRDVEIEGSVDLFLLPAPGIRVGRLRVANAPGFAGADALTLGAAEADVAIWPLLSGAVRASRIRLVAPVLTLERRADGAWNWAPAAAAPPPTAGAGAAGARVSVADLTVEGGRIAYRDAAGRVWEADGVAARLVAEGVGGPVRGRIDARVAGQPVSVEGRVGRIESGGAPAPVSVVLGLKAGDGVVKIDGSLAGGLERPQFSGRILADAADPIAALAALALPGGWLPQPAKALYLRAEIAAAREGASLNDLKVTLGDNTLSGAASLRFGADPRADVTLAMTRLDLDAWWPSLAGAPVPAAPPTAGATPQPAAAPPGASMFPIGLDLGIDAVAWRGGIIRGVKLALEWQGAGGNVEELRAEFPGAALATAFGSIGPGSSGPRFEGRVEAVVDNLRALLHWQGLDPTAVPADRLRSLSLAAGVRADGAGAAVDDLDLRLDSSRLTGAADVQWRQRRFDATLAVDRVNLDAYLPAPPSTAATAPAAAAGWAPATGGAPWRGLVGWEGRLQGRIAALTHRDTLIQDLDLDAAADGNRVILHGASARAGAGAGAGAHASGEMTLDETPEFRLALALTAPEAATLARLAGLPADSILTRLRLVDLKGNIAGRLAAVTVDLEAGLGSARGEVRGSIADPAGDPGLDLTVAVRDGDLARLLAALDLPGWPLAGAGALVVRAQGPLSGADVGATLTAGDLAVTAAGRGGIVDGRPSVDVNIVADHPRAGQLLAALRRDPRPIGDDLGPFHAAGRLAGDLAAARLTGLDLRLGATVIRGDASLALASPRPRLTASLTAGDVILDPLLPPRSAPAAAAARPAAGRAGGSAPPPDAAERWSSAPLDLDFLRRFDARIDATMRALAYGAYRVDGAALALGLEEGVLTVERLGGMVFKGQGQVALRLAAAEPATVDLTLTLKDADLGLAFESLAAVDDVSGRVSLDGTFRTHGRSVRDLVAALAGDLRIDGGKGAIEGVDLRGLSDQLHRLDGVGGFAGLLQQGMSRGQTRLDSIVGTVAVRDGIATTEDLAMHLDGGDGRTKGEADLPRWDMDLTTLFRLAEHPQAPPIGLRLRGPLDAPERTVLSEDLEAYFARRLVGGVMRRLLPGEARGPGALPAPAAPLPAVPALPPSAEQAIKDLLKGLGR